MILGFSDGVNVALIGACATVVVGLITLVGTWATRKEVRLGNLVTNDISAAVNYSKEDAEDTRHLREIAKDTFAKVEILDRKLDNHLAWHDGEDAASRRTYMGRRP